jgi:CDP-diacylglycerol--glycerol-3-phosphate 3-phosphatidyltransferase
VVSDFGKLWDPLADKFIVMAALAALTWKSPMHLPWIIWGIIFVREAVVTIMREVYAKRHIVVAADIWGKLKTVLQMVGITVYLGFWAGNITTSALTLAMQVWFWIVTVVTVLSGINYLRVKQQRHK